MCPEEKTVVEHFTEVKLGLKNTDLPTSCMHVLFGIHAVTPPASDFCEKKMTLTFNTHLPSLTIGCPHLLTFRSQAAILSEKSTVFTFSYRKNYVTKFDLAVN